MDSFSFKIFYCSVFNCSLVLSISAKSALRNSSRSFTDFLYLAIIPWALLVSLFPDSVSYLSFCCSARISLFNLSWICLWSSCISVNFIYYLLAFSSANFSWFFISYSVLVVNFVWFSKSNFILAVISWFTFASLLSDASSVLSSATNFSVSFNFFLSPVYYFVLLLTPSLAFFNYTSLYFN